MYVFVVCMFFLERCTLFTCFSESTVDVKRRVWILTLHGLVVRQGARHAGLVQVFA